MVHHSGSIQSFKQQKGWCAFQVRRGGASCAATFGSGEIVCGAARWLPRWRSLAQRPSQPWRGPAARWLDFPAFTRCSAVTRIKPTAEAARLSRPLVVIEVFRPRPAAQLSWIKCFTCDHFNLKMRSVADPDGEVK